MSAQVAADLRAAADVLERDGWTRFYFYNRRTHCRCAVGALRHVTGRRIGRVNAAAGYVGHLLGTSLISWNDGSAKSADQVITALRAAADAAELSSPPSSVTSDSPN